MSAMKVNLTSLSLGKWPKVLMAVIVTSCFAYMTSSGLISPLHNYRGYEYFTRALEDRPAYRACVERHVVLAKHPLPVTALASFPGSGNTWTRHLIQQLTGIGTSSEYCDIQLLHYGFPFECSADKSRAIVTKTHELNFQFYDRVALLIRNPYETLLTFFKYSVVGHTNNTEISVVKYIAKKKFDEALQRYVEFYKAWLLTFKGDLHLIQYKALQKELTSELSELGQFLNVDVTNDDVNCTVRLQQGKYHRKANTDKLLEMKTIYTENMKKQLKYAQVQITEYVQKRLKKHIDLGQDIMIALNMS